MIGFITLASCAVLKPNLTLEIAEVSFLKTKDTYMEKGVLKDFITMQKRSLECAGLNPGKTLLYKLGGLSVLTKKDILFGFTQIVYQTKA